MGRKKSKGNGEGTLYINSKTGLYVGQYVLDGKRKSVYQKKNEKTGDFKIRFNKILANINEGTYINKSTTTLEQIIDNHIEQKLKDGIIIENSYRREKDTLTQVKKTCDNFIYKPIQKVTLYDVERAKEKIKQYKKNGIDKIWRMLFKGFRIASSPSIRLIPYNIMDDENLKKPISVQITEKVKPLTVKEEKHLLSILNNEEKLHPFANIIKLQYHTAMRIGEVLARSISNIDKENKKLLINNTLTYDRHNGAILGEHTKTYNKETGIDEGLRNFPITPEIGEILEQQVGQKVTNIYGLLFWDYQRNTFVTRDAVSTWLRRINDKYKITNSLHSHRLRHTRITRWKEQGMDMNAIQYLVGHVEGSSITNKVYIDVSEEFAFKELEKTS